MKVAKVHLKGSVTLDQVICLLVLLYFELEYRKCSSELKTYIAIKTTHDMSRIAKGFTSSNDKPSSSSSFTRVFWELIILLVEKKNG